MKKICTLAVILTIAFKNLPAQTTTINLGTTNVEAKNIYTSPGLPWELKYGPGDSLWMTTRQGQVFRINAENGGSTLLLNHTPNVAQGGEAGMLGMTFHPQFSTNPFVFIAYTYLDAGNIKVRLSRFTYGANALSAEVVLIQNITGNTTHDGSRLLILPDNTILMTTGDAQNLSSPQNVNSLNGKILRLNLDGTIPANNPFPGSAVYTTGHRNGQGLMLHPNGKIYETEHGPDSNDEFQIIEAGRNYGWPNVYGFCDNDLGGESAFCSADNVKEPLASWNPIPGGTWAPNDLIWYSSPAIPEFQNTILVSFLKTNKIRRIQLDATGEIITGQTDFFVNQWGRLRDITTAPNGDIFIATNSAPNRIFRIRNLNVLPVNLSNIKSLCLNGKPQVTFTAENEINVDKYFIYGSNDKVTFEEANSFQAQNTTSPKTYTEILDKVFSYFKIVYQNMDGSRRESTLYSVNCNKTAFKLYPNPASDMVNINVANTAEMLLQVYSTEGKKVLEKRIRSNHAFSVKSWAKGLYIARVAASGDETILSEKFIVN